MNVTCKNKDNEFQSPLQLVHQVTEKSYQPAIHIIETGGTISCADKGRGLAPAIGIDQMISEFLPNTINNISLSFARPNEANHFGRLLDSANIQPEHWIQLANLIKLAIDDKVDGVLVLTGTDTMAYTTAALSILVAPTIPVVITGSQYPFGYPGGDARDNFMHGLTASIIEKPGVYAVFGGELFPGNQLHKVSTVSPKAFTTINPKHTITPFPMGNRMPLDAILRDSSVKVELIVPGYEPRWLEALLMDKSVKGIVLVAYGAGGLPTEGERSLIPLLGQYSDKKPIVIVSQTIHGGVDLNKYEVGQQLLSAGVIPAGIESLEHASFKLKYLIAQSFSIAQIRDAFGRVSHE